MHITHEIMHQNVEMNTDVSTLCNSWSRTVICLDNNIRNTSANRNHLRHLILTIMGLTYPYSQILTFMLVYDYR